MVVAARATWRLCGLWLLVAGCSGAASGGAASGGGGSATGASTAGSAAVPGDTSDAGAAATGGDAGEPRAGGGTFVAPSGPQTQQAARLFAEGNAAYAHGDFPSAGRAFRQVYDLYPSPEMAFNLARVYERMGEVADAVRYFELVLASHPEPAQRTEIERRIAALRAYEQRRREGIAQAPASSDALTQEGLTWFQRGVQFYRRRQYAQAQMAFEQAYQYTHTPELFFNLAMTHERLNHLDRAIEFLQEYLGTRRGTPEEAEIEQHIHQLEQHR